MIAPQTFSEVIGLWANAAELGRDLGVKDVTVRAWRNRGVIPAEYWADIEAAAERRGYAVTVRLLAEIAAHEAGRAATEPCEPELKPDSTARFEAAP